MKSEIFGCWVNLVVTSCYVREWDFMVITKCCVNYKMKSKLKKNLHLIHMRLNL